MSTLEKSSMKSMSTIERQLSLLRLPLEAQERVKTGKLNITKGYIFAANIHHPLFWDLFNRDIKRVLSNFKWVMQFDSCKIIMVLEVCAKICNVVLNISFRYTTHQALFNNL